MSAKNPSRRRFLTGSAVLAGSAILLPQQLTAGTGTPEDSEPLIAYVGTFSSPLQDVLPTQVDLPPGNGKGIHI